ncbi:MAG: dihydropteroate synthase [Candidatus Cloacimonetes bacterium]|nr:dihydropteroate synthase [Candidatus Cloacimonadota bacterium]
MNRILYIKTLKDVQRELEKINVSSQGIGLMAQKALELSIKLTNVHIGAANILKQEMLSIGGDAAVARGVVNGIEKHSDMILLGNADKIKKLIKKLENQTIFGLPDIKEDLKMLLQEFLEKPAKSINCNGKILDLSRIKIMGVLNVTPNSFSDGTKFLDTGKAVEHALEMINEGADIIDIGGESTRPNAEKIDIQTEMDRVIPVIEKLQQETDIPISIDTYKAEVAEKAIEKGASIVNEISALRFDNKMVDVLKKYRNIPVILMHMQGTPQTMQKNPYYEDTIEEILQFFKERIKFCNSNGIEKERIIIDPGIGFGKRHIDNLVILKKLSEFKCFGLPIMIGSSRKSFIGRIYKSKSTDRLEGSLAATALAFQNGVEIIRVHDVKEHKRFLQTLQSIKEIK